MTEQIEQTYTTSSILKRIIAFMIDFIVIILMFSILIFLSIGLGFIGEEALDDSESLLGFKILSLIMYFAKDSFKGISFGKWIMGIMIRNDDEQKLIPSFWILFIRNLYLVLWPIELLVLIFDKNNKRLGDRNANIIVLNNPDAKKITYRIMILILTILSSFGIIALLAYLQKLLS